jgi:hypothetical protein
MYPLCNLCGSTLFALTVISTRHDKEINMAQQAFILWWGDAGNTNNNLAALNQLLAKGWKVVLMTPMSGTGERGNETPQSAFPYSRAALILEQ